MITPMQSFNATLAVVFAVAVIATVIAWLPRYVLVVLALVPAFLALWGLVHLILEEIDEGRAERRRSSARPR